MRLEYLHPVVVRVGHVDVSRPAGSRPRRRLALAIEQAVALDPFTAEVCTLDQIHELVEEIFATPALQIGEFN